jgi:hypothetical protein
MTDSRSLEPCTVHDQSLVAHDIRLERRTDADGEERVVASIECERRGTLCVTECRACPRFARIEVHEAGYLMLCRAHAPDPPQTTADAAPREACTEPTGKGVDAAAAKEPPSGAV